MRRPPGTCGSNRPVQLASAHAGFSGFEALQGGSGNDAFVFANGTVFPGSIDGGAGSDTLNFAACTTARSVLLTGLGSADGFDGSEASLTAALPTSIPILAPRPSRTR